MMPTRCTVHVAFSSDQNYVHGLNVTAVSVALYADPATSLHFHVLDGGIDDVAYAGFERLIRFWRPRVALTRHRIDTSQFARCPAWSRNRMTYARLLMPALLEGVDRVVYSDTDVLWLAPVEALWDQADEDTLSLVTRDGVSATRETENAWYASKGLRCPRDDYFCAGVMLLNLKRFREERLAEKAFDFIHANPDVRFADQTALNHLLFGRVRILPEQWQTLTVNLQPAALSGPVVLHYANEIPWARNGRWGLLSDTVMIWHRFNDRFVLGDRGASLKRYYRPSARVCKRFLFLLLLNHLPRRIVYRLLAMAHRALLIPDLERYLHALGRTRMKALLQHWERLAARAKGGFSC